METQVLQIATEEVSDFLNSAARIVSIQSAPSARITFVLESLETGRRRLLLADMDPSTPTFHLDGLGKHVPPSAGFGQRLRGAILLRAELDSRARLVSLHLRKPVDEESSESLELILGWTGTQHNAWLLSADRTLLERLRSRGPRLGEVFEPPAVDTRPLGGEITPETLAARLGDTLPERWTRELSRLARDWDAARALDLTLRALEEVSPDAPLEFDEPSIAAFASQLLSLAEPSPVEPVLYEIDPPTEIALRIAGVERVVAAGLGLRPAFVSAAPLPALADFESRRVESGGSLSPLLSKAYRVCRGRLDEAERRQFFTKRAADEMKRLLKLRKKLSDELGDEDYGPRLRRQGETILAHLHEIDRGASVLVVPNLHSEEGETIEIELDPRVPANESAERLFHKARRWSKGRPSRQKRIEKLDAAIANLSMVQVKMLEAKSLADDRTVEDWIKKALATFYKLTPSIRQRLEGASKAKDGARASQGSGRNTGSSRGPTGNTNRSGGSGSAARKRPEDRFHPRRYETEAGWTVIVGRSNEENDYVTHRLGKQDDYWFHAHGVPGSHVLLKRDGRKDNPSQKTIREAAAIAAYFSKAKHSSRVPVIYTLKKYVRKPRKAKAGLAQCSQETMVMVAPRNPEAGQGPPTND